MAQFEYQVLEQAGGRVSHMNERLMLLVVEGWEPLMMTGSAPHISLLMRRPMTAQPAAAPAAAAAAPQRPAAPAQPGAAPQPTAPRPAPAPQAMPPRPTPPSTTG